MLYYPFIGCETIKRMESSNPHSKLRIPHCGFQAEMKVQLENVKRLHAEDLAKGCGEVYLPGKSPVNAA